MYILFGVEQTCMHWHVQKAQQQQREREREKKTQNTEHNEVRVKLKNFSGGFSANT